MKTIFKILFTLVITFSPVYTFAQATQTDAYTLEMNKMLAATNAKDVMINTIARTWQSLNLPLTNCDEAATAVVDAIWPDLVQDYITEYKKYFTLDDMKAINKFYETPTGEKFAKYSLPMSTAIQTSIQQKYAGTIQQILMKYIKQ